MTDRWIKEDLNLNWQTVDNMEMHSEHGSGETIKGQNIHAPAFVMPSINSPFNLCNVAKGASQNVSTDTLQHNWFSEQKEYQGKAVEECQYDVELLMGEQKGKKMLVDSACQTEGPPQISVKHVSVQSDESYLKTRDIGTQSEVEKRSVACSCQIKPSLKHCGIQAISNISSIGVSAKPINQSCKTQTDISGSTKPKVCDIACMCNQSPGAIDRHCQTFEPKKVTHGTMTKSKKTESATTDTNGLTQYSDNSCQTGKPVPEKELRVTGTEETPSWEDFVAKNSTPNDSTISSGEDSYTEVPVEEFDPGGSDDLLQFWNIWESLIDMQ
jgi:hypothetical protein